MFRLFKLFVAQKDVFWFLEYRLTQWTRGSLEVQVCLQKIFSAPLIGLDQCGSVVGRPREIRIRKVWVQGLGFSSSCGDGFWRSLYKNNVKETSTQVFNKLHHTLLLRNTLTKLRAKILLHHSWTRKPRRPIGHLH